MRYKNLGNMFLYAGGNLPAGVSTAHIRGQLSTTDTEEDSDEIVTNEMKAEIRRLEVWRDLVKERLDALGDGSSQERKDIEDERRKIKGDIRRMAGWRGKQRSVKGIRRKAYDAVRQSITRLRDTELREKHPELFIHLKSSIDFHEKSSTYRPVIPIPWVFLD